MSKEIVKKEKAEVAVNIPYEVDQDSLLIGRLLMAQKTSGPVDEGKAAIGDTYINTPFKVLAKLGATVKIVPIKYYVTWHQYDPSVTPKKWLSELAQPPVKPTRGFSRVEHGGSLFIKSMNFYVMLESELSAPGAMPYLLSFMNTSERAGKALYTTIVRRLAVGSEFYTSSYSLGVKKESKDKNTYTVWTIEEGAKLDPKLLVQCKEWATTLANQTVVIPEAPAQVVKSFEETEAVLQF